MDAFEYKGYWWLADHEERKYPGTLTFAHDEGLKLQIFGSFSPLSKWPYQFPAINGRTLEGKHFTLLSCDSRRSKIVEPPDYVEEELSVEYAFERSISGLGKIPPDSRLFHKAFVQYTCLPDWLGQTGLRMNEKFNELTRRVDQIELTYKRLEKVSADLGRVKVSIVEGFNVFGGKRTIRGVGIRPILAFEIEAEEELDFETWCDLFVMPLGDFLTLATGQSNAVTKLSFHSMIDDPDSINNVPKTMQITVYAHHLIGRIARKDAMMGEREILFGFQDIKDEFSQILQTWFLKRNELESTMDLFFAIANAHGTYLDNEFLNLAQALEVYHRKQFDNWVIPKSNFKVKKKAILESVPEEFREWLTEQPAYANQPKLHHRILELLRYTQVVTSKLVSDTGLFARKVTDTRNFLTHFSRRPESVMEGEELFRATQVLSYMIQTCIMLELGLSEERIVALFGRNQKFLQTALLIKRAQLWQ